MGLFSKLFKARDKLEARTSGSSNSFLFGGTTSGKSGNKYTAMQMASIYFYVRILAVAVAGLLLHLYKYIDSGGRRKDFSFTVFFIT